MFYDISDVCRLFRLSPNSVRYYESLGLIHPARTSGGRRKFSIEEMRMLLRIKSLQQLGLDLQTIKDHFINETPFVPKMLSEIMDGKIIQMEQQIRYLQSSVDMLRQYEQRLQEAALNTNQPQSADFPNVYFLPMKSLFGRSTEERDMLSQWFDAIPLVRKMDYYQINETGSITSCSGYCIKQDGAIRLSLPMLEKAEHLQFANGLKFHCTFPWLGQRGLTTQELYLLADKVRAMRPWQNIRVLVAYLYGVREESAVQRHYEIWISKDIQ